MKKRVMGLVMAIIFTAILLLSVSANAAYDSPITGCSSGILNNGTGGIYIDINSSPYTITAKVPVDGKYYAYTSSGCAWFASARVKQLTGKCDTIWSGKSWYETTYANYGFSRGQSPKAGALICWSGHVAILEKIDGNTAYISEGGCGSAGASHGYCHITSCSLSSITSRNSGFLGYVYFGGGTATPTTPADIGTNIYTYILNKPAYKPIVCVDGGTNVVLDTDKWIARQRWFATRNSDGSYYFMNAANNKYLTSSGTNVQVGDSKTKWFVYDNGNSYLIQLADSEKVLDLAGAKTSDGTNIQLCPIANNDAQAFTFYQCNPTAGTPVIKKSTDYVKTNGSVSVSWDKTDYSLKYEYFLAEYPKGYAYTTNSGHGYTTNTSVEFSNLVSGDYSVFVHGISADSKRSEQSNWVTFKVYADDYIPTKTVVSNNHIYALYDYEMSWSFARDLCKELGGNLVTVTSAKENAVITDLIQSGTKDAYWLGATDIDGNDKDFKWVTDETFSYSNWMSGEPNSAGTYGEKEHFIEVRKSYGNKWNDVNNISKKNKGFILEVDLSKVSPTAEGNFKGNKYLLFDKNTTWTEAQEICKQYDGHLATIENTDESTFIKNFLKAGKRGWYYLGGQKSNNTWKWLDGTAINTVTWDDSAPNWDGTNLMMYKSDGSCVGLDNAYYPENDISKIGFVCEIEAGEETPMPNPTPTAAPTPKPTPIPACFSVDYGDGYVDITNTGDTMQTVSVIEANYSGKTFVDLKSSQMTFGAGEKRTVIIDNNTKIFVWDSLSGMKPLLK